MENTIANFFVSLTNEEIARQIANLINKYNYLYVRHNRFTIITHIISYFVEIFGNQVVGCTGIIKENVNWSIIKHVCVEPKFRRKGIASKLINLAIQNCKTRYVYMIIRENNIASLCMANKLGFTIIKQELSKDYYLMVVGKEIKHGTSCYNS
ncbi:MAG: GNAT family N-acetyltransferase [Patescibacteria group bacterium]|nr:GNAT family N-acetyltransferase [Patescibacteria group bacterium]